MNFYLIPFSELLNQLEAMQFCRLSDSYNIDYNTLTKSELKSEPSNRNMSAAAGKLIFQAGCIAAQANRPVLRALLHQDRGDTGRHFTLLSALAVAEALQRIATRLMGIPPMLTNTLKKTPTEISLEELVRLLRHTRAVRCTRAQISEPTGPSVNWMAYSCDGTLTLRYPTGDVALLWTPAPTQYCPPDLSELHPTVDRSIKSARGKPLISVSARANKSPQPSNPDSARSTSRPVWNHRIRSNEKTAGGYWLFVFDLPAPRSQFNSEGSTITTPNLQCRAYLNANDPGQTDQMESGDERSPQSDPNESGPLIVSNEEYETESVGQLRAFFTPTGEGAIYTDMTDAFNQSYGNTLKAVFTDRACSLFDLNKSLVQTMPWPKINDESGSPKHMTPKSSMTTNLQTTVDMAINPFVRIHCANREDIRVTYNWENRVKLILLCGSQIPRESKAKKMEFMSPRKSTIRDGSSGRNALEQFVTKVPFLNSMVESVSARSNPFTRRRREEAFKRIFKDFSPVDGNLDKLQQELSVIEEEIRAICERWLKYLRDQLALQRFRSPRPRTTRSAGVVEEAEQQQQQQQQQSARTSETSGTVPVETDGFRGNFGAITEQQSVTSSSPSKFISCNSMELFRLPCPFQPNPRRAQRMPLVECPIVIRAWLETQVGSSSLRRSGRSLSQSTDRKDHKWNLDRALMRGCCCSRLEPPTVTDQELDVFLEQVIPVEQAIVVAVFDSREPSSLHTEMYRFVQEQYMAQQRKIPTVAIMRSPRLSIATGTTASAEQHTPRQQEHSVVGVGGTGACATIITRMSHYRFVTYDLHQPQSDTESLLRRRHGSRPRVGDVVIFLNGRPCHIGSTLSGYSKDQLSKWHLERRILECRYAVFQRGFILPIDFQLP
ncbi:hypothetical protein FGIG_01244 [Fasciola gigantica]|uniref:Uncharacterized protein n=1 Tax=Fasciola gigantica TaxID=46835 RepID=A0A504YBN5_FASGI|nr:hypothetical protein FGIG_01244 [Fasciola gigantica]